MSPAQLPTDLRSVSCEGFGIQAQEDGTVVIFMHRGEVTLHVRATPEVAEGFVAGFMREIKEARRLLDEAKEGL